MATGSSPNTLHKDLPEEICPTVSRSLRPVRVSPSFAAFAHGAVADAAGPTVTLFAGVASAPGVNDTAWRSEVTLWNGGDSAADVLLEIVPRNETGVVGSLSLTLAAGETRRVADPYAALNAPAGAGTLRVTGDVVA